MRCRKHPSVKVNLIDTSIGVPEGYGEIGDKDVRISCRYYCVECENEQKYHP
jgi:hypothetical protein